MKSHLETRSVARHVAIANREEPMRGVRPPFLVMARVNSIGCGQGRANGRQQDQRCERGTRISWKRASKHLDPALAIGTEIRSGRCLHRNNGGNYGSRRTSLAAWGSNPDHYSALAFLALKHAAQADRNPKGDKRYVRPKQATREFIYVPPKKAKNNFCALCYRSSRHLLCHRCAGSIRPKTFLEENCQLKAP